MTPDFELTRRDMLALGLVIAGGAGSGWARAAVPTSRGISIADAVESVRFMTAANPYANSPLDDDGDFAVFVSPDRRRYAVMTLRGDLASNTIRAEILVGGLETIDATQPVRRAAMSTSGLPREHSYGEVAAHVYPGQNPLIWSPDSRHVHFLWADADDVPQIFRVDADGGGLRQVTQSPTAVRKFAISRAGDILYHAALPPEDRRKSALLRDGFVVDNEDALSLLDPLIAGDSIYDRLFGTRKFLLRRCEREAQPLRGVSADRWILPVPPLFSPDGRKAIVVGTPIAVADGWLRYREPSLTRSVSAWIEAGERTYYARQMLQLYLVDVDTLATRPLWDCPYSPSGRIAWSPDSRAILVAPSYLPAATADALGLRGAAAAEIDVDTGAFQALPLSTPAGVTGLAWDDAGVRIVGPGGSLAFRKAFGAWVATTLTPGRLAAPAVRVRVEQDANRAPALAAASSGGARRVLLDPNPWLQDRALAVVEFVAWPDGAGRTWRGRFYRSPFATGPAPIVLQTHGFAPPEEFSLYGKRDAPGLGPGISVYSAQALAGRGIHVLQIEDKYVDGVRGTPAEPEMYDAAFTQAVRYLTERGDVDPARVGIVGHSRSGWHVAYAIALGRFDYAAAIMADCVDASYSQTVLVPGRFEAELGGPPYGATLADWLERSPVFNAERIRTPLRIHVESGPIATVAYFGWELFVRLRQQRKPVELYVVPEIARGSHGLQNPRQCAASQEGAVDWFDFWLNGREPSGGRSTALHQEWRRLRDLRDGDLRRPRPAPLEWQATARQEPS